MSARTVTVGCKLPHGLHLDLPGMGRVTLKGLNSSAIINGHGLTHNVDGEFFDAWMQIYKDHPAVVGGFIFAHVKDADVTAEAKDRAGEKTGLEPLDPGKPGADVTKMTDD